ncbi:hypothetical protein ASPZODRAFT_148052 [Penicilliopsis zonata CBS 506.65]|uniref:Ubiquitin carboxyl-terminal hydrolase 19 n=1 Tax=Penicilliopsis zonata CBS 506.65 TaxID=1073090 RepID=A0A1L9SU12_9EURO|nr:hypothetical protein ASPZODRAFT_148052 [Penicilliopsis zonata CBS 506.65]OJJ50563.1 hypothetical protein ASPZODRAFT_148052 [Penicilliopsis zonata CBS 506.65]
MDAQYPFASREDIWRVFEELKELHATQFEQGERIARLERRRDEDARLKSVWGPVSPFPSSVGSTINAEPVFHHSADAFRGFDQGPHHSAVSTVGIDVDEEPRRGASRANSVRFDESAIHGYYGQASRSSSELPLRTGSGMGSHPLTERSLSHRSDGRRSSSGHSHHSARTNSLGLETSSRMMGSSVGGSPLMPPPGLFLLGPVPCIIRCWLTTNFSNESLLYAAACSGSYSSSVGYSMIQRFGLEDFLVHEDGVQCVKLPLYLPEASIHTTSSRASSPAPQVPTVTVRFIVRDLDPSDTTVQIILGSDVLRSHNADVLFSQDKIIMVDDDRNKISIPLVRPENEAVFKCLHTAPVLPRTEPETSQEREDSELHDSGYIGPGVIGRPPNQSRSTSAPSSNRVSMEENDENRRKAGPLSSSHGDVGDSPYSPQQTEDLSTSPIDFGVSAPHAKIQGASVWSSWRRDSKLDSSGSSTGTSSLSRGRPMKVLRPSKSSSRISTVAAAAAAATAPSSTTGSTDSADTQILHHHHHQNDNTNNHPPEGLVRRSSTSGDLRTTKQWASNPIGGASAFGWLNTSQQSNRTVTNPR